MDNKDLKNYIKHLNSSIKVTPNSSLVSDTAELMRKEEIILDFLDFIDNNKKLQKANGILIEWIKEEFQDSHWVYINFVNEDRFYDQIKDDIKNEKEYINKESTSEELAEYAIDKLENTTNKESLFGF